MNELIKITYDNDRPLVSARELHDFLEVGARYNDWFPRMCEYGFSEGTDFYSFLSKTESAGGRPSQDAMITLDMAKELCMIQRNEKGKQARQYFIQLEKDWNSPEKVMARALDIAHQTIKGLKQENEVQAQRISEYEPKIQYLDRILQSKGTVTTKQIAADYDITAQALNAILHDAGIQYKVKSQTVNIVHSDGTPDTIMNTRWTQKGRLMIHELLTKRGIMATMDKELTA